MKLQNHFLIATPKIHQDSFFSRTVIYICEHNSKGSMGLIINRASETSVAELCCQANGMVANSNFYVDDLIHIGGPLHPEKGFILYTRTTPLFENSMAITDNIILTSSIEIVKSIGKPQMPEKYLMALGCCIWQGGQLVNEIQRDDWLVVKADEQLIFDTPIEDRYLKSLELLGLSEDHLVGLSMGYCQ